MAVSPFGKSDPRVRLSRRLLAILALAAIAIAAAAAIPSWGGRGHAPPAIGVKRVAARVNPANGLTAHVTTVFGSSISAKKYGTQIGNLENEGTDANGQL